MTMKIFDIEQKENTPEMLAFAQGKPTKNFEFAQEFNTMTDAAVQSAIDNLQMDFYWQNTSGIKRPINDRVGFIGNVQLLGMHINSPELFQYADKVVLHIDRYKAKRKINRIGETRPSGYKHAKYDDARLSEIRIDWTKSVLDFGQEYFFKDSNYGILVRGSGHRTNNDYVKVAKVYLQFSLIVTKGDKVFKSTILQRLTMLCQVSKDIDPNPAPKDIAIAAVREFIVSYSRP